MISLVGSGLWHRDLHAQRDLFLYICKTFNKLLNYSLHFMLVMPCNRYKNQSFASNFCVSSCKSFTAFWRQGFLLQLPSNYQTPDYRSFPINGRLLFCIHKGRNAQTLDILSSVCEVFGKHMQCCLFAQAWRRDWARFPVFLRLLKM